MYGVLGAPITLFSGWVSSTVVNARSRRTCWPPPPPRSLVAAPLGADSPTVSAAAAPVTAATARTLARLVRKTMLTSSFSGPGQPSHPPFLLFCAGLSQDRGTEWIKFVTGEPASCGEAA